MNWAWSQTLEPTPKLILMALADIADDTGRCWPKLQTLAKKCSVSTRTVQRWIRVFEKSGLLTVWRRYNEADQRQMSNEYMLHMHEQSIHLSDCQQSTYQKNHGDFSSKTPCLKRLAQEKALRPRECPEEPPTRSTQKLKNDTLCIPRGLASKEKYVIEELLKAVPQAQQQLLLDELRGAMAAKTIHTSLISWFRALAKKAREGGFSPTYTFSRNSEGEQPCTSAPPAYLQSQKVRFKHIQEIKQLLNEKME